LKMGTPVKNFPVAFDFNPKIKILLNYQTKLD